MFDIADLVALGVSSGVAQAILTPLYEPIAEFFATNVSSTVLSRWKLNRETVKLGAPEDLPAMIAHGQVLPGQMVQGSGYFSLLRPTHPRPEIQLHNQTGGMIAALMAGGPDALANSITHVHAATGLPSLNGTRMAFIYPHHMWGFGAKFANDGTPKTIPFLGRIIILMKEGTWLGLPDRIVEFRARMMLLDAADLKAVMPEYTDDLFDTLLGAGKLSFLDARDEGCFVRNYDQPPNATMFAAHVLSAHWGIPSGPDADRDRFVRALEAGIAQACADLKCTPPTRGVERAERDAGSITWFQEGFQIYQPSTGPTVHVQMNTDHRSEQRTEVAAQFSALTSAIVRAVDSEFSVKRDVTDVDFTDAREAPKMTILQSPEARHVDTDPALAGLRHWLEKK
jgi:hypothetical protein